MKSKKRSKLPKHYTGKLSRGDKKKQEKAIGKSKRSYKRGKYYTRPKMKSFKNKKSSWTQKFHKLYPEAKTLKQIEKVTGIPKKALSEVKKKGMGAYYSSGSRPNQTAESWGKARMYAYIFGSPTRKYDHHITQKYKVKFKFKPKYYDYSESESNK
jgi:hypothetical protein